MQRRVVITGAAGRIGRAVTSRAPASWDVVATDLHAADDVAALDVTDEGACRTAFAGADAVVHLAAVPDPDAPWEALLPANVVAVHAVARAAADAGVARLVLASSVQALSALPDSLQRRSSDAPRPANLYGATKAWAEAVGSWIAATTDTSVVALRIAAFGEARPDRAAPARARAAWLSGRDAAELVRAAVEAQGVDFVVAMGTSANRYPFADLRTSVDVLGYAPFDDAWAEEGADGTTADEGADDATGRG